MIFDSREACQVEEICCCCSTRENKWESVIGIYKPRSFHPFFFIRKNFLSEFFQKFAVLFDNFNPRDTIEYNAGPVLYSIITRAGYLREKTVARYVISIWVLCKARRPWRRPRRKQQKQVLFKHETRSFNKLYLRLKGWEEGEHELDGNSKRSLRYARDMFESSCSNLPPHTHTHTPAHISKNFISWKQCELTCSQQNFSHWTLTF